MGSGDCRKSSLERGVESVVCRVWGVQCKECKVCSEECAVWNVESSAEGEV